MKTKFIVTNKSAAVYFKNGDRATKTGGGTAPVGTIFTGDANVVSMIVGTTPSPVRGGSSTGFLYGKFVKDLDHAGYYFNLRDVAKYEAPKPMPTSASNFSGAEAKAMLMNEGLMWGAGIGAVAGLSVSLLAGTNKISTTLIGAVAFGAIGYNSGVSPKVSTPVKKEEAPASSDEGKSTFGADGRMRHGKRNAQSKVVACYGAGYAYHTSGHCKSGETQA